MDHDSVTPSTDTKINGFVNGTAGDGSDKYYTYDLVISKDVEKDTYAETTHAFPFHVTFSNPEGYISTFTIGQTAGNGSTGLSSSAETLTGLPTAWSGDMAVKDGGDITLTGIPAGVDVSINETNDLVGVTYQVTSKVNDSTEATDDAVAGNTGTSTAVTVDTPKIATVADEQTVEIINTLLLISPTGVALRVAPFVLMLAAGAVLLFFARRRRSDEA